MSRAASSNRACELFRSRFSYSVCAMSRWHERPAVADAGRTMRPELKVLFITRYAENAVVGNGHLDPGMHVLTKPFAMEALASRIRELIAGGHEKRAE